MYRRCLCGLWPASLIGSLFCDLQGRKTGYDKKAFETDPALPAFTRRREVFAVCTPAVNTDLVTPAVMPLPSTHVTGSVLYNWTVTKFIHARTATHLKTSHGCCHRAA